MKVGTRVTCHMLSHLPHLTCKRDHIKMRDYMHSRVTQPRRVTSPTWGPLPPCKQALTRFREEMFVFLFTLFFTAHASAAI